MGTVPPVMRDLARSAVDAQRVWNARWLDDMHRWRGVADLHAAFPRELLSGLAPARIAFEKLTVSLDVEAHLRRDRRIEIGLRPLNLGFELRYGSETSTRNRVQFDIEQIPVAGQPPAGQPQPVEDRQ